MLYLSLQGSMAVRKIATLRFIEKHSSIAHISYERNGHVLAEIKNKGLNKNNYKDYLEIQKLFIENECQRYKEASKYICSVMDFGAEEIEFYTLNYPKAIGVDWDVTTALKKELQILRNNFPKRILYLNATDETLLQRKTGDCSRNRDFFDFYIKNLLPLKRKWFLNRQDVDILEVDNKSIDEVSELVFEWIKEQIVIQ
ncbi:hypothetical protein M2139_001661 [Enterococcus sp. PF1-24]|uniref:hypothetical protein n=1 Tax=unclassified Enterococcus TaxID=2608891 RepID=UPI002473A66E|nr:MULTISPECIES: hypothetical protein [unclassified Enterococcus]MDH6364674.1 hypothetical protein [Enterococcus sp. PFB1-1]MDH6401775.1 hypothetical protein [Enterococcus sp. PF1-24]